MNPAKDTVRIFIGVALVMIALTYTASSTRYNECRENVTKYRDHVDHTWNCSYTFLLDFPKTENIPVGTTTYDLSHNRIWELHAINVTCDNPHNCQNCLRNLYLNHNSIDSIEKESFRNLVCLHTLDLSYNKITGSSLSLLTFHGLLQLETLSLRGNPLHNVSDFTLMYNELRILKKLDLSNCDLVYIAEHAFDDIALLEELNLSGNKLTVMDPYSFHGLTFLKVLDLRRNQFSVILDGNFEALVVLNYLYLDENRIKSLPDNAFKGIENLELLSLAENLLEQIPFNSLKMLLSLRTLNMSRNHIAHLEASHWPPETKLRLAELYLDNMNYLQDIAHKAFVPFPLLKKISISKNQMLQVIAFDAFQNNSFQLKEVYLYDNGLEFLAPSLLPWMRLEVLNIDGNPWNCNCRLRWMLENTAFTNMTIRCSRPEKLSSQNLMELSATDLSCPKSLVWILLTFLFALSGLAVVVSAVLLWKYRQKLSCRKVKGRYISVYQKDVEDDTEGTTTINLSEDEVPLKDAAS